MSSAHKTRHYIVSQIFHIRSICCRIYFNFWYCIVGFPDFFENELRVLKCITQGTFFSSQITHGLITRNVFSINYFYSFFITSLPFSLSKLNLKNCYFCHLSTQTWLLAESALFAGSLPHLFYPNFADFCFFWQGLILVILPFPIDVKLAWFTKWFIRRVKDL